MSKKIIDYSLVTQGPMQVDPKYLKPGYHYVFVGDLPGQIEQYERYGYEIVKENISPGDNVASKSTHVGSAVVVSSKCGQKMHLMAIEDELYEQFEAHKKKMADNQMMSLNQVQGIPSDHLTGSVKMGSK